MRVQSRSRRTIALATGVALSFSLLAACSDANSNRSGNNGGGGDGVLNVGMPNGPQANNSNPLLETSAGASLGYRAVVYEPLVMTNGIAPEQEGTPWLAEEWSWNEEFTELVLTVREGPTWSDGEAFDAEDVAFTFQLLKDHPGLNTGAIPFEEISQDGNQVRLTFGSSQFVNQVKIYQTFIVPEHIWSQVDNPETYEDQEPVGTGPYTLKTFTPQTVTLTRRDSYWQELPEVEELRYTSYNDNNAATTALSNGELEWSYVFIPNYEDVYLSHDPEHFNLWFPTGLGIHGLWINTEREPFDDVVLRQAMNLAVDRQAIHEQGHAGAFPVVESPTGLPLPAGDSFLAPEYQGVTVERDVEAARALLEENGYGYEGDTLLTPEGEPVTMTLVDPAGWSDYLTSLSVISDNLAEIGIEAAVETATVDGWRNTVDAGGFDATLHWTNGGATPYDSYQHVMDGTLYKPIGEASAGGNFGRFQSEVADAALQEYANATDDAARTEAMNELQRVFVEEVPMIPTVASPIGAEFSTRNWVGWPTEEDPYAPPQPTQRNALQIVLNLEPADG
ncbi:ABC transporter substrate-binding protein [Streptomyces sp. DSM 44915]|uniref:ABC transporter substrate-binding protein n=1 Tax=Streptomyces chisholmiae TaxID=3075540 RepID=A0ABU2JTY3_9ACTN|nr:ABC transporter substrate-binding protein [Streptomyces sp. DSM 44915]MDT0268439.1 ABC transporter substrate-binding protein [Streptomyces sp. DSM 44915]